MKGLKTCKKNQKQLSKLDDYQFADYWKKALERKHK